MRKILLLSAGIAFLSIPAGAKDITPSQAKAIAAKYVTLGQAPKAQRFKAPSATASSAPDFYAFNDANGKGFVLIAGDDCVTPILGYSTNSTFSQNDMAPSLKAWLDAVSADIQTLRENGKNTSAPKAYDDAPTVVVAPLIKTHWDQSRPYYDLTPTVNGQSTMTGCVATALSQVMNYYQWPVKGTGSVHYDTPSYDTKTMDVDLSQSTYDWANMCDNYTTTDGTPDWNEEQGKAVATLMHDVGAAIHMSYGVKTSGCWSDDIANTMRAHFGYNVTDYEKWNYTTVEWMNIIKRLLDGGDPLAYSGQSVKNGGHEFVVDGYDSNNFLHVNWGWSGSGDGYYAFTNFGSSTIYFNRHMGFVHLTPNKSGTIEPEEQTNTLMSISLSKNGESVSTIEADKASFAAHISATIQHASWKNLDAQLRFALTDAEKNVVKTWGERTATTKSAVDVIKLEEDLSGDLFDNIADGTYALRIQLKDKRTDGTPFDEWCDATSISQRLTANISDGHITMNSTQLNAAPIIVKSLQLDKASADFGDQLTWTISLDTSNGEDNLLGKAILVLSNTDDPEASLVIGGDMDVTVFAGQINRFSQSFQLTNSEKFKAGNYEAYLYIVDSGNTYKPEIPGGPQPIKVSLNTERFAIAYADKASLKLHMGDEELIDCDIADGKTVDIDMAQDIYDLYFDYDIKWKLPTPTPAIYHAYYRIQTVIDGKTEVRRVLGHDSNEDTNVRLDISTFDEIFAEDNYGKEINWVVAYTVPYSSLFQPICDKEGAPIVIKIRLYDSTSGINDLATQAQAKEYYDLQGRRMSSPAKGINIIRMTNGKTQKVMVK